MAKKKFDTLEAAQLAFDELEVKYSGEVSLHSDTKKKLSGEVSLHQKTKDDHVNELKLEQDKAAEKTKAANEALAKVSELTNSLSAKTRVADEALAAVGELSASLDAQEKHGRDNVTLVSIGKKKAKLTGSSFIISGFGRMTAKEVAKSPEALQVLWSKKSAVLTEI